MAVTWGGTVSSGSGNWFRLGYEFSMSPTSVGQGTPSVVVTVRAYVQTRYPLTDSSNTFAMSGDIVASLTTDVSISHGGNSQITFLGAWSKTFNTSYSGTIRVDNAFSLTGLNAIPGQASVVGYWTIPRRPYQAPARPDNLAAVRVGDQNRVNLSWTNQSTSTAPWTSVTVQRWAVTTGQYVTIATLAGTATAYSDTTLTNNNQWAYRVRANGNGSSAWNSYGYIYTLPPAPTSVAAKKSGSNIVITWASAATVPSGHEVWHLPGGGAWELLGTAPSGARTWTHSAPDPTKTHTYRLRTGASTILSPYSANSNTVQLLTAPAAPTLLNPLGGVFDAGTDQTFTWRHNSLDTTEQNRYRFAYREVGGTYVYLPSATTEYNTGVESHLLPAGTLTNGLDYEWTVSTGGEAASRGPFAAPAPFATSQAPSATISAPEPGVYNQSSLTVEWAYYDPEGGPQTAWEAMLVLPGGVVLETRSGTGEATSATFTRRVDDATTYSVRARVQDDRGLWSPWDIVAIDVEYPAPPVPLLAAQWHPEPAGQVTLTIDNGAYSETEAPPARNEVWRSADAGTVTAWEALQAAIAAADPEDPEYDPAVVQAAQDAFDGLWAQTSVRIAMDVPVDGSVTDMVPALNRGNLYQAVASSDLPSTAPSAMLLVNTPVVGWVFLNGGDGWGQVVRLRYAAELNSLFTREKRLNRYAGREYRVETAGEGRQRKGVLNAIAAPNPRGASTVEDVEALADGEGPVCYRDPLGHRWFMSAGAVTSTHQGIRSVVRVELEQVDADG